MGGELDGKAAAKSRLSVSIAYTVGLNGNSR